MAETIRMGKKGTLVLPAKQRKRLGLEEGTLLVAEETVEGILLTPAVAVPIEIYSPDRIASLLLSNAVDEEEYARLRKEVEGSGINPDAIDHLKPVAG